MRTTAARALLPVFLCVCRTCASLGLGIESTADLDGTIGARLSLTGADFRVLLLYQGSGAFDTLPALGLSLPWLRLGPLAPRGLLRETESPLGFSAGSEVFREDTDLTLDGSLPVSQSFGLLLAPIPGSLAFFCGVDETSGARIGGFGSFSSLDGWSAEGLAALSRPAKAAAAEEWYFRAPPFPGGIVSHAAGRLRAKLSWLSLSISSALSACSAAPAGCLVHAHAAAAGEALRAEAFIGAATPGYVTMRGQGSTESMSAGCRLEYSAAGGSFAVRYSISTGREELASHPFIPTAEKIGLRLETVVWGGRRDGARLRISAERDTSWDSAGGRSDDTDCALSFIWSVSGEESSCDLRFSMEGIRLGCDVKLGPAAFTLGLEGTLEAGKDGMDATALVGLRIERKDGELRVRAGVEGMPLEGGVAAIGQYLRLELGWESRTIRPAP